MLPEVRATPRDRGADGVRRARQPGLRAKAPGRESLVAPITKSRNDIKPAARARAEIYRYATISVLALGTTGKRSPGPRRRLALPRRPPPPRIPHAGA